ncbi:uncharacterized protein LOC129599220 [Paramacrobiotus metropolitanus]|uniref:uncharacterized protein LOC129599220 n=1 Tax=Paramacrobiotus metropolitanus TaxID=2943436 RepID=UPI002445BCCC|nr:uncharacterized protein LOC129599220 [Paramacrobiotus metropolitanus]
MRSIMARKTLQSGYLTTMVILSLFICAIAAVAKGQLLIGNPDPVMFEDDAAGRRVGPSKDKDGICLDAFSLKKGSVVQVSKSEKLGGRLINATTGLTGSDCLKRCCQTEHCTVAAFEQQGRLACYLFNCGYLDDFRCELVPYSDYEVGILTVSREALKSPAKPQIGSLPRSFPNALIGRPDGHDNGGCRPFEFRCTTSGECIAGYDRCNGAFECPDRSDEANCEQQQTRQEVPQIPRNEEGSRYRGLKDQPVQIEDELRMSAMDENEQTLWDRGRNRPHGNAGPNTQIINSEKSENTRNNPADEWNFKPETATAQSTTLRPSPEPFSPANPAHQRHTVPTTNRPSTAVPLDRISSTVSIISSTNPHDIQSLHIEKSNNYGFPSWVNFSDPTHFIISVVLIIAVAFCAVVTLFVICRCICARKPKVTKYRIVDPDAEDFLLGGSSYS